MQILVHKLSSLVRFVHDEHLQLLKQHENVERKANIVWRDDIRVYTVTLIPCAKAVLSRRGASVTQQRCFGAV